MKNKKFYISYVVVSIILVQMLIVNAKAEETTQDVNIEDTQETIESTVSGGDASQYLEISDIDENGETKNTTVPSTFGAQEEVIGKGLQVKIPADFNPTYNQEEKLFICEKSIIVEGELADNRKLKIETTPEILYYAEDNEEITVPGIVTFGEKGIEYWTTQELKDSNGKLEKPIIITIDRRDIIVPSNYKTLVEFSFKLETTQDNTNSLED